MIKYILPVLIFISNIAFSQGYNIGVKVDEAKNKQVFLAHYYINNVYITDTVQLDDNGEGVFAADTLLPQGLYMIYLDNDHHFDFLLGADQQFTIENPTFAANTVKIKGAVESEQLVKYLDFLTDIKKQGADIQEKMKTAGDSEKEKLKKEVDKLTAKLQNYWKKIDKKYPGTFLAKFLMANYVPVLDESTLPDEVQKNDSLLFWAKFEYQKKHYWDYFDYTDERFLYTPLLKPKLETWFTQVLFQQYDSVQPYVIQFIENVRPKKRIFQYVTSYFLNKSINSNIMGMDALFVDIAKKYYLSGEAFWATEESMKKIRENVLFIEPNLIGKIAPDLTMETVDGEFEALHKIDSKLTVVLIYEPNCSHCKVYVPRFYDTVFEKYKDKGLAVFAVYSMDKKDEWTKFIDEHKLWDWINVWDKDNTTRFKILYDVRKTPRVYLLDENKKIIAKDMSVEQMDNLIGEKLN